MEIVEKDVEFKSEGEKIAGKLLLPDKNSGKLSVIIVLGPWTQVKEQVQYFYGKRLAEQGYAVLNFDFRYWGDSGGEPRHFESTSEKIKDVLNAIEYVKTIPSLDASNISLVGVCAGAGIAAKVTTVSKDIKRIATVAAWLQHPASTPMFYGGEEGIKNRILLSENAEKKYKETGTVEYVEAYNPDNPQAAMFFPLDYYRNPERGAIPDWDNKFAVMSWKEWMNLNVIDGTAKNISCPIVMIHSDESALPDNVKKFYNEVPSSKKELVWLEGEHTQFYDSKPHVEKAISEIVKYFQVN